ncbi:non-ribosomal peptide synthetase [Kitasatospora viridis]|uniref:Amino acid adenylation domain-containing protein n=1 Tax=Kitasatospora viridis TaxID=281105 RepID=A0A561UC08_9ACTN|nr:non-ribosomal peptide synthetase [Kitasatospora viridis]TWF96894.1 amino acid adenylation domain-containing protein [Kitasatospora viridis]
MSDTAPASFAQRRLWFLDQFTGGNTAYNLVSALRLTGPLDVPALHRALQAVVDRHDVLRTTFTAVDGEPRQRIAAELRVELPLTDLRGLPAEQRAARAAALVEADTMDEFDLATGPLLRTALYRLGEQEHVFSVVCHHAINDGWSMGRFHLELSALYPDAGTRLDPLPMQFAEYAERERAALEGPQGRAALARVRERLTGAPAVLELPTTHPRPAVQGFAGAVHELRLDAELWQRVLSTARANRATPFMTLLTAFAVQLSRLSGARDLVIGSPAAGRTSSAVEPLIGMFVNTLPLRLDLTGEPTFAELLLRTRRTALAAFADQGVPLEQVVTELQLDRTPSHDPLFQVMFALQQHATAPELPGITVGFLPVRPPTVFTDLWLDIRPHGDGALAVFRYRTELFDAPTVARLAEQYRTLLDAALTDPQQRVADLPLLDDRQTEQVLREWGRSAPEHRWDVPVHELIDRQIALTPGRTAVAFEGTGLSYLELAERTGRIAARLAEQGVRPGSLVALCLPRGLDLVPAILAVLRSGCAYLPLSPEDPPERLARLLGRSGAAGLLTTAELAGAVAPQGLPVLAVDTLTGPFTPGEPVPVSPDDLAYVIHTSGSTGEPKAVGVPHRGLANRVRTLQDSQQLTPEDRVLQKTPYTFDVSVQELLWPLTLGATLVVAAPGGHRDPAYLVELIEREAVTTVHFVPPMLEAFLGEPDLERCGTLRRVLCSGQALPTPLVERCLSRLPVRLTNFYGPTEASIEVTEWDCRPGPGRQAMAPIGRPIPGAQTYVLDAELRPVPVGVAGELYLGGVVLARGYLGRPDLTADRFVPHPFGGPGDRLYRTGDLVRWQADGTIDFLGRNDHQLKLRGFRIEPGEIENALRAQPEVRDAVVALTGDALTGYLLLGEPGTDPAVLRERLRDQLPRHMVPTHLMVLPAFPVTASGKVDRAALPLPTAAALVDATVEQAAEPADELERTLARIWGEVLGVTGIGRDDDFFGIGGDSLKSTQVVHRAREAGLTVSVSLLFHHPTIAELAERLRRETAA